MHASSRVVRFALAGLLASALVSCGSSEGANESAEEATGSAASSPTLEKLLPADIRDKGALVWGVEPTFPPSSMMDDSNKNFIGVSPDIARAVSQALGIKADIHQGAFDGLIPGVQADRYDLVISSVADTKEREQVVDFVDYTSDGTKVYVPGDNPESIQSIDDLCGRSVALLKSSVQVPLATEQSKKCQQAGKDPLDSKVFPDNAAAILALTSGRAEAVLTNVSYGDYTVKQQKGAFISVGPVISPFNVGIVVKKGNEDLRNAVKEALEEIQRSGAYKEVLDRYGLGAMTLDKIVINEPSF